MSLPRGYPPDTYHGEDGEASAWLRRGGGGASMLLMFAPGGPREDYSETLARGEQMSEEERAAFMLRHDTFWV